MEVCQGIFTNYEVFDRIDFAEKMRAGVPIAEYMQWEKQQNKGLRIPVAFGRGRSAGKNRYLIYQYMVGGYVYYAAHTTAYSRDIRMGLYGKPCRVLYDPANPFNAKLG